MLATFGIGTKPKLLGLDFPSSYYHTTVSYLAVLRGTSTQS